MRPPKSGASEGVSKNTGSKSAAGGVKNGSDAASVSQCGDQDLGFCGPAGTS
ncbi:hypothetical protein AB0O76_16880 [Streptomyces sp. NPDC086554]|uniref:hypothetical protein n=1 Tax=Streptomyces sp. NPDC086554 TaxID=3154864 RepID=UPI0034493A90